MANENLLRGIEAARNGEYERAASYLAKVVQAEPNHEDGWLLLGHCLADIEKRRYCYQKVLRINPSNEAAKASLYRLDHPPEMEEVIPEIQDELLPDAPVSILEESNEGESKPDRLGRRRSVLVTFAFGLLLSLLVCALPSAYLIGTGRLDGFILQLMPGNSVVSEGPVLSLPLVQTQGDVDTYTQKAMDLMEE